MKPDNFRLDVYHRFTPENLSAALRMAFANEHAVAWSETSEGLVLYWSGVDGADQFPCPLTAADAEPIVSKWLQDHMKFAPSLGDFDGHDGDGFQIRAGAHAGDYEICRVWPRRAMYHK